MSLQALCFAFVVKLKKKDEINVSYRDALKRTLLSAFFLARSRLLIGSWVQNLC